MKMKRILVCDGSVDGIFTAIYEAYDMRYGHEHIQITEACEEGMPYEMFAEYVEIVTNYERSEKVASTIRKKISTQAYESIVRAALSNAKHRSDLIYRFVILGLREGKSVLQNLSNEVVFDLYRLNRAVAKEAHHMTGFLRFSEVGDGILLSVIQPKHNIISLIVPHFSDRLNNENFIIFDEGRNIASIHHKNQEAVLVQVDDTFLKSLEYKKEQAQEYEQLWKTFYHSVSIKERENLELQRNNLPLRYRSYMTEFRSE